MIIVDSREKKWDHIRNYFDDNNICYTIKKLDAGDYINQSYPEIVIDRKAHLQELCGNLSKGNGNIMRFTREVARARKNNIRLIILIEGTMYQKTADVIQWKSKYSTHTGKWLYDKMFNLTVSYGVEWMFCRKRETGAKILEILKYDS